jgi:hypothetical protein
MQRLHGTVHFNPLEGGIWVFETDEGARYQLDGLGTDARRDGQVLTILGEVDDQAFGIGMVYPIFKVKSYIVEKPAATSGGEPA